MIDETALPSGFFRSLKCLLNAASPRRRVQLVATMVLTLVGAIAELVTIGAVLPVLAIAAKPESMAGLPIVGPSLTVLAESLSVGPVVAAAIVLTTAAIGATFVRFLLLWTTYRFVFGIQQDLSLRIFGRALRQPYSWYLKQNSSVLIASQQKVAIVIGNIVTPLIQGVSSAIMALFMALFLFVLDPYAAIIAAGSIALTYFIISLFARRRFSKVSYGLSSAYGARTQTIQETLGGIRDINLDQSQSVFEERLRRVEDDYRRLALIANLITAVPRLVVEGIAIILVAVMAAWFSLQPGGVLGALPILGALALGAQRMLPMIQMIYHGYTSYSIYSGNLNDVLDLLDAPIEDINLLPSRMVVRFSKSIELRDLQYNYGVTRNALNDINLTIVKGERIGFIGKTGSGKSTLVDIVMGLLPPTSGKLLVDGGVIGPATISNWKSQIAHVPQVIFLSDSSISANIAFGIAMEKIDPDRVARAAREAGLNDFLGELENGLETTVGERGIRLSGGQRQRIGIARALYKRATVLVLDEATSALDDETEAAVMASVERLDPDLTIILIAHRLSTLGSCDRVYRLAAGRIVEQGSYADVTAKVARAPPRGSSGR